MKNIHINSDLGEGGSNDARLMEYISACNIACGGHAGTLETMHETVMLAMKHRVEIGAHPSYPDKENFGRKSLDITPQNLQQSLVAQILSLKQIAEAEGGKLNHIKPHGALYNDAAKDEKTAKIVIDSVLEFSENLPIYTPENSALHRLSGDRVEVVFEAFADRNYNQNFELVSRQNEAALITEKGAVWEHLFSMYFNQEITCLDGVKIPCKATTFCLHSDTPNSVEIIAYLEQKLRDNNIEITKL